MKTTHQKSVPIDVTVTLDEPKDEFEAAPRAAYSFAGYDRPFLFTIEELRRHEKGICLTISDCVACAINSEVGSFS